MRGCIVGRSVRRQRDEKRRLIRVMANDVVVHLDQNSVEIKVITFAAELMLFKGTIATG